MDSFPERGGFDVEGALSTLTTHHFGKVFRYFENVDSTNEKAASWAHEGASHGSLVVGGIQSEGHGRLKREWISPRGGLWLSAILRPKIAPEEAPKITLMAGVAVSETIHTLLDLDAVIKWPNDVLVRDRKVCGILTEMRTCGDDIDYIILGLGINVNFRVNDLPEDVRDTATTLMEEHGDLVSLERLLKTLLKRIEALYEMLESGNSTEIMSMWKNKNDTLGRHVRITTSGENVEGVAVDLDKEGALVVKTDDGILKRIFAGDCIHLSKIQ
jgi:BirA family biotin operon repressor/biotin-[acetyl-CoA-carboxylase] ligase